MGLFSWMFKKKPRELSPLEIAKGYKRDSQGVIRDKYDLKVPQPDKNGRISDGELYAYMSSVDEQRRKIDQEKSRYSHSAVKQDRNYDLYEDIFTPAMSVAISSSESSHEDTSSHSSPSSESSSHYDSGGYDSGSSSSSDSGSSGSD